MKALTEFNPLVKNLFPRACSFFAILIFCAIACKSPSGHSTTRPEKDAGGGTGTIPIEQKADLVVTNVEITPPIVIVGTPSPFNVYVSNNGNITSGDFDINVYARHAGNVNELIGCCYPTHMRGVRPGEQLLIYTGKVGINDPGSYELAVVLKLADGTQVQKFWPFTGSAN